jgi:O-antigen ligase
VILVLVGRVLDPAWVIVALLYMIGPVGIVLLDAGVSASALALLAVALVPFVLAALWSHPDTRPRLALLSPLLLLLLLAAVSLLWTPTPSFGGETITLYLVTGLLPATFVLVLANAKATINWKLVGAAAFVYSVALLSVGDLLPLYPGRPTLFGANPIWAARAAYVGALVVLFGPFRTVVKVVAIPTMVAAGMTTQSDGPALGFLVGAWVGVAVALRAVSGREPRAPLGWLLFLAGTAVAAVVMISGGADPIVSRLFDDPNVSDRVRFLDVSLSLFLQSPVLGIGIGGFSATGLAAYPHNLVAEIGSELGVLGIGAIAVWIVLALRGALRSPITASLVVATTVFALFSGDLSSNIEFFLFTGLGVSLLPVSWHRRPRTMSIASP